MPPQHDQKGEVNSQAKLTDAKVRLIRASNETNKVLAERFGVSDIIISLVKRGKRWRHITHEGSKYRGQ